MAKQQTNKSRYPSRYSPGGFVSAAQYISELICEKRIKFDSDGELPQKFWDMPEWSKFYKYQIILAHKLLKKHPANAIIAALKDPKTRKTFSLANPYLLPIIKEHQKLLEAKFNKIADKLLETGEESVAIDVLQKPRERLIKTKFEGLD